VEDVAAYLKDKDADAVIKTLQDAYARLQMQEVWLAETEPSRAHAEHATRSRVCCSNG
jgi:hypothetical protein